jgi:hypothetical protein
MGRSGCEQVRHTNVVFVSTEVDKIAQSAGLSSIRRKNLSRKLRCVRRAHTPARLNARHNSAGRIAVAMVPSGRDERWVSAFLLSSWVSAFPPLCVRPMAAAAGSGQTCQVLCREWPSRESYESSAHPERS